MGIFRVNLIPKYPKLRKTKTIIPNNAIIFQKPFIPLDFTPKTFRYNPNNNPFNNEKIVDSI